MTCMSILVVFPLQIMRDPETGNSRGFGFISYDSFDASDAAIEVCTLYVLFPLPKLFWLPAENPSHHSIGYFLEQIEIYGTNKILWCSLVNK